jgi:hypothetical protein
MPDNKNERGQQDRSRVSGEEKWELNYMMEKFNVTGEEVQEAIKAVGNSREKVEDYLRNRKA